MYLNGSRSVSLNLSVSSSPRVISGFSFLPSGHVYRLCYVLSLCMCMGQMLSGYGVGKGLYVILISWVSTSSLSVLILLIMLGLWYPLMWSSWLYPIIRPGGVSSSLALKKLGGFRMSSDTCMLWSFYLIMQFYVLLSLGLLYM